MNPPGVNLTVLSCSFTGNQANSGGGNSAVGGAIDTSPDDTATISGSQFISNSAIGNAVGATVLGGAVNNNQTMTIDHCLFTGNSAVGGPMPDGVHHFGGAQGGAIRTGGVPGVILTLSNSIVADNEAIGGSGGSTLTFLRTGYAYGGGICNNSAGTLNVTGCTVTTNQAIGGASASGTGGFAQGGGIQNFFQCRLNLRDSTISSNHCQGGQGASGYAGGLAAAGGIGSDNGAIAILTNSTITLNECLGGPGGAGANGGEAVGGGIANAYFTFFGATDASSLIMSNCQVVGNVAQGGTAGSSAVGGDGLGGGLYAASGTIVLEAVLVNSNQSQGGGDGQGNTTGNGLGGGVYVDPSATATAYTETIIAGNQASKDNNDVWGTITMVP